MIHDKRELTLTRPALMAVLAFGHRVGGFGLPPGDIRDVKPRSDGGCDIEVVRLGGEFHTFTLQPINMMAMFIAYARQHRIPLPKRAAKQLLESNGAVVVRMTMIIET